ncbi:MAG: AraC family transcriptional regulator [Kiritimatiellae bacterium]|nr:AraC family transcriptional regulator [Kiritimatiellia bacterium]
MDKYMPVTPTGRMFSSGLHTPLGRVTRAGRNLDCLPTTPMAMRYWDIYSAVYVLKGRATYHNQDRLKRDIGPGDLILMFPRHGYRYVIDPGARWSEFFIQFRGPLFGLWMKEGLLNTRQPVHHLEPLDYWWKRLEAMTATSHLPEPAQSLKRVCLLQDFLVDAVIAPRTSLPPSRVRWLAEARRALETDIGRAPDWEAIAQPFGMSARHFRRRFADLGGVTPARYRAAKTIEHAEGLLADRTRPIKDIASACGFCDEFHFGKRFKALTGLTPVQFRERLM